MRVVVLGATGRTGRLLVEEALGSGHDVVAPVRDPRRIPEGVTGLHTVPMPVADPERMRPVLEGADAVVSVLNGSVRGGWPASGWVRAVLEAADPETDLRIVVTSAAPVGAGSRAPLLFRLVGWLFRDSHRDLARMEELLRASSADWTVVRPPRLTDGPRTASYRTEVGGNVGSGWSVSRADLAHAVLALVGDRAASRRPVGLAY